MPYFKSAPHSLGSPFALTAITLAGALLAMGWAGCNGVKPGTAPQSCQGTTGDEFCPCRADGSCKTGLVCATDLLECVHLAGTPPVATGGITATGGSTGGVLGTGGIATGSGGATGAAATPAAAALT